MENFIFCGVYVQFDYLTVSVKSNNRSIERQIESYDMKYGFKGCVRYIFASLFFCV